MKLGKTKRHLRGVIEMTFIHFEAPAGLGNGFLEQTRKIVSHQCGFTSLSLSEEYILTFWWGTKGPTFCVFSEDEETQKWVRKSGDKFGKYFRFQARHHGRQAAIQAVEKLRATFGCTATA